MELNYYDILQVPPHASPQEIKQAFKALSKRYHPDVTSAPDDKVKYEDIRQAYEILSNPELRHTYHEHRWLQKSQGRHAKTYTANTVAQVYKQLLQLEHHIFFADIKRDNKQQHALELAELLNERNCTTILNSGDAHVASEIVNLCIKLIPDMPLAYVPHLQTKLQAIQQQYQLSSQAALHNAINNYKRSQRWEQYRWLGVFIALAALLGLLIMLS